MHPLTLFLFFASCLPSVQLQDLKALDEFVNRPDFHYGYTFVKKREVPYVLDVFLFHTINMTSQKWLDESEVDKPVWTHQLTIALPKFNGIGKTCLLILNPGQKEGFPKSSDLPTLFALIHLSFSTRSAVAVLNQVPVEPLTFYNHPLGWENIMGLDIEAYSWWRFINDSSVPPEYLVQFPMVKATVRAMDTITDYMMKTFRKKITKFTLTGISMNGLTAWLTAAVDKRVAAIIPIAMDFLNFTENFLHHYEAYCGWSYMLKPFYDLNITENLDDPRFALLASHVDPMAYNERYASVVKFLIILSGDELFRPDNSHYYFSQLEGEKYLHIIPNADYIFLNNRKLSNIVITFHNLISRNRAPPRVSWQITTTNTTGIIDFKASPYPNHVFCYQADTTGNARRDFRMKIASGDSSKGNPVEWTKSSTEKIDWGTYKKELKIPKNGWRGFFLQAVFPEDETSVHLTLTTELHIIPDTFPCPDCSEDEDGCHGTLV